MSNKDKNEEFKIATANTFRAIANKPEIEVSFSDFGKKDSSNSIILPVPDTTEQKKIIEFRGTVDEKALRLRYHDKLYHEKNRPASRRSKQVFDALEKARYESLGSNLMQGVANNLNKLLQSECEKIDKNPENSAS